VYFCYPNNTTQQSNDAYALPGSLSPLLANSISISILLTSQGLTLQVKRSMLTDTALYITNLNSATDKSLSLSSKGVGASFLTSGFKNCKRLVKCSPCQLSLWRHTRPTKQPTAQKFRMVLPSKCASRFKNIRDQRMQTPRKPIASKQPKSPG
jgi:hypothetical protein